MAEFESLWTAEEAAEYLKVSASAVRKWARAGELPSVKAGRNVRFEPDQVRRWTRGEVVAKSRVPYVPPKPKSGPSSRYVPSPQGVGRG